MTGGAATSPKKVQREEGPSVRLLRYDRSRRSSPRQRPNFMPECVGDKRETVDGRLFDTMRNQFAKNGDSAKRIVLKMDVEGAEWDSLLSAPDEVLGQIDQMVVEFHGVGDERNGTQDQKHRVVQRLKRFFEIGHIHFNNATCTAGLEPFPGWAYEVLFVQQTSSWPPPPRPAPGFWPAPARCNRTFRPMVDCQPKAP